MQSGVRSLVYNVAEQVNLDPLRAGGSGETIDAQIAKVFNRSEAPRNFQRGSYLTLFYCAYPGFSWRKADMAMEDKKYSTAIRPIEPVDTQSKIKTERKSLLCWSHSQKEHILYDKLFESCLKRRHGRRRRKDVI